MSGFVHQPVPTEIAEDGDNHVKGIERSLEGNVFVEIESAGDDVNNNPDEPLFEIFACQGPDAHDTEGCGETVGNGNGGVGEMR